MIVDKQEVEQPLREDRFRDTEHRDIVIVSRYYRDGHMTIDLEGDNVEALSAVEVRLKVALMRKGMLGLLRSREQIER